MATMKFTKAKEVSPFTLQEILVYLAVSGVFDEVELPDWATGGTQFEEVFKALEALGNASDGGPGIPAGFDEWFTAYCAGKKVPHPSEITDDEEDDE